MTSVTDKGLPERITPVWFRMRYGQNFPDLLYDDKTDFLQTCINDTYTLFYGVNDLWRHLQRVAYVEKTQLCYGLLVAWYITDVYPDYAVGVVSSGGIPIKGKRIGGVSITYGDSDNSGVTGYADLLQSLKSNSFGAKAYMMIRTSGKINLFLKR